MESSESLAAQRAAPSLGALADRLFILRNQRLDAARHVEVLKDQEKVLQEQILLDLQRQGLEAARGKLATVATRTVTRFSVADWDQTLAWIAKTGAIELLERRVNQTTCRERLAAGETIDGVQAIELRELSITKKGTK
jgi:hypothetical protein